MRNYDVIIIGAGAAGLMCAIEAGKRGRAVWLIDHAAKLGEKIRISGGGRCNFTNIHAAPQNYLCANPHFCKSALKRFTQHDFIALVEKHGIDYHEKTLGQLFCDKKSQLIIDMLRQECADAGVRIDLETTIEDIEDGYTIHTNHGVAQCQSLVIATGGLSIPKIGASKFGYDVARQFGIPVTETRAGLVPLTFTDNILDMCKALSGVAVDAVVSCGKTAFREGLLFTHRGLSGPSILQISSYWHAGEVIRINLAPDHDIAAHLKAAKTQTPKQQISSVVADMLPKCLAKAMCDLHQIDGIIGECADKKLTQLAQHLHAWEVKPNGTEGYRTAEITLGGVDTDALSSKTMEAKTQEGLYFIGEVVDVTGHLGGFNFQWAWSSGFAAGQFV